MPRSATPFPRAIATFNGQAVRWTDVLQIVWEPNVAYAADGLTLVLRNLTSEGLLLSDAIRKKQLVDLYLGYVQDPDVWSQSELGHVFHGKVDGVLPHFGEGLTLEVRARDLSSSLLDQQVGAELNAQSFDNMTASDFAAFFAKKYGLGSQITATTATADRQNFENQSEWALLVTLAMREGFICSVDKDGVLYFGPRRTNQPILSTWSYFTAPADLLSFDPDDSALAINRVTVLRYAGPTQDFSGSWPTEDDLQTDPAILAAGGQVIDYTTYSVTAQSSADCQDQAQKLYTTMNRRRISATARMEGDPTLIGDVLIHVGGLVGRMENDYYVERAVHTLDVNTGYVTQVDLTNIQPTASEVYRDPLYQPVSQQEQQNAAAAIQGAPPGSACPCAKAWTVNYPFRGTPYTALGPSIRYHRGVDLILPGANHGEGTPIQFFQPGTVTAVGVGSRLGERFVMVTMANGLISFYCHMDTIAPNVVVGATVNACDPLGTLGQTGTAGNPHLHFEIRRALNGDPALTSQDAANLIDPTPYYQGCVLGAGQSASGTTGTGAGLTYPLHPADIRGTFNKAPGYVQTAIKQAGWPQSEYDNAAAISYNETGGRWNPDAHCLNCAGVPEDSRGLWQINVNPNANPQYSSWDLYDPSTCAKAAYQIWSRGGWSPWSTAPGLGLA